MKDIRTEINSLPDNTIIPDTYLTNIQLGFLMKETELADNIFEYFTTEQHAYNKLLLVRRIIAKRCNAKTLNNGTDYPAMTAKQAKVRSILLDEAIRRTESGDINFSQLLHVLAEGTIQAHPDVSPVQIRNKKAIKQGNIYFL